MLRIPHCLDNRQSEVGNSEIKLCCGSGPSSAVKRNVSYTLGCVPYMRTGKETEHTLFFIRLSYHTSILFAPIVKCDRLNYTLHLRRVVPEYRSRSRETRMPLYANLQQMVILSPYKIKPVFNAVDRPILYVGSDFECSCNCLRCA
jgi:hypothetical protein